MREEIIEIVTAAAASIGINAVQENPSDPDSILLPRPRRSEERRVGKEGATRGRLRWST